MKIKLGIFTDEVSYDLLEALEWATANKIDYIDLRDIYMMGENINELSDEKIDEIERITGSYNLPVKTICPTLFRALLDGENVKRIRQNPALIATDDSQYAEHLRLLQRSLELATRFNAPFVRTFAFFREGKPETVWEDLVSAFYLPVRMAEKAGKILLLENESLSYALSGSETASLIRAVGSSNFRAIWDPANAFTHPETPFPDGYHAVKSMAEIIHAKDVLESGFTLMGKGAIDWNGQLQALVDEGFCGSITIETHTLPEERTIREETEDNLAFLKARL